MQMTEYEIRRSYEGAKNKKEQIGILADLNLCPESEIQRMIDGGTIDTPTREGRQHIDEVTRKKIAEEYLRGNTTHEEIAKKYGVAKSSVIKYVEMYKNGESLARKPKKLTNGETNTKGPSKNIATIFSMVDDLIDSVTGLEDFEDFKLYKNSTGCGIRIVKDGFICEISKTYGESKDER